MSLAEALVAGPSLLDGMARSVIRGSERTQLLHRSCARRWKLEVSQIAMLIMSRMLSRSGGKQSRGIIAECAKESRS